MSVAATITSESPSAFRDEIRRRKRLKRESGEDGARVGCLLHNVSLDGFLAEADGDWLLGASAWLKLDGFDALEAKVVWQCGHFFGFKFAIPLSPDVLEHVLQRMAPTQPAPRRAAFNDAAAGWSLKVEDASLREPFSPSEPGAGGKDDAPLATRAGPPRWVPMSVLLCVLLYVAAGVAVVRALL